MACTPTPTQTLFDVVTTSTVSTSTSEVVTTIPAEISTFLSTFCGSSTVDANGTTSCLSTQTTEVLTTIQSEYLSFSKVQKGGGLVGHRASALCAFSEAVKWYRWADGLVKFLLEYGQHLSGGITQLLLPWTTTVYRCAYQTKYARQSALTSITTSLVLDSDMIAYTHCFALVQARRSPLWSRSS